MKGSSATRISVILVNAADTVKELKVTKLSVGATTFCNSDDDDELLCSAPSIELSFALLEIIDFDELNCKADPFSLSKHFISIDESLIRNILEFGSYSSSSSSSTSFGDLKPLSALFPPSLSSLLSEIKT